jgi:hypothetical protein
MVLDENLNPVEAGVLEWAAWFERKNRIMGQASTRNGGWVSCVFIGIDDQLWEVLYRRSSGDEEVWRFDTLEEAMMMAQRCMSGLEG